MQSSCREFEYMGGRVEVKDHKLSSTRCLEGSVWHRFCIWCGQKFPIQPIS